MSDSLDREAQRAIRSDQRRRQRLLDAEQPRRKLRVQYRLGENQVMPVKPDERLAGNPPLYIVRHLGGNDFMVGPNVLHNVTGRTAELLMQWVTQGLYVTIDYTPPPPAGEAPDPLSAFMRTLAPRDYYDDKVDENQP